MFIYDQAQRIREALARKVLLDRSFRIGRMLSKRVHSVCRRHVDRGFDTQVDGFALSGKVDRVHGGHPFHMTEVADG